MENQIEFKYVKALSADHQAAVSRSKLRNASLATQLSGFSVESSTLSDFLAEKMKHLTSEAEVLDTHQEGLFAAKASGDIGETEFNEERRDIARTMATLETERQILEKQERTIERDMEDDLARKKTRSGSPDLAFYERAYTNSLVPRVMTFSGSQQSRFSNHEQAQFRGDVLFRYNAKRDNEVYFHLTGWFKRASDVKAAHLVPKGLSTSEVSFLFGVGERPATDARNGISLYKNIELALDKGQIVIIPTVTTHTHDTNWKCVLVHKEMANLIALQKSDESTKPTRQIPIKWNELDGKQLDFLTINQPARRFLYFRFLITYLNAKVEGNTDFTTTVETRKDFWASPGPYLERSTLKALARNISGLELPAPLAKNTFDDNVVPPAQSSRAGTLLAHRVREATIESYKRLTEAEDKKNKDSGA